MSEILVLGAGMVGVSTALALQARGHEVTLADRREPGRETSYGNAGIIQVEAAEPYAIPRDLKTLLSFGLGRSNDVSYSLSGIRSMVPALMRYFANSSPKGHAKAAESYSQLTGRASEDHQPLILASGSDNLITREGLVILLRGAQAFDEAAAEAERFKAAYGVQSRIVAGEDWRREEPALRLTPAGAVHYTDSWSVSDPGALTQAYAKLFETRGGRIVTGDADTLARSGEGWQIATSEGPVSAEQAVICLGPWSGVFLRRFGVKVPMVLKRGYHAHYDAPMRPRRPFLDAANGVVLSNMRLGMRMTSGAQLVPQDAAADPRQLRRAEAAVDALIELGPRLEEPQWYGSRPCLPGMLPMLGALPGQPGLWTNFGHGHQGFTLGPTTGTLLAEAMEGAHSPLLDALSPATQLA
ncbi:FAD-binding oxidoreductase [Salipiger sp. PrR002]|uniref:NAD(P)/FAD-dependent oxidoreductase n=1 Tax=Salipiger sp. PrR002 TaxID=2706489 RepID=UPI0013B7E47C|nr:FAD-binding oxidoreductase [Salipiger sp. PrR002]NDW01140.1 FAD-binding oxidoreductase [Salipiger sp. PrR002]NDW57943.1 FAD-binding oxidoreductase [Salipiger sp. PrR004]